MPKVVPTIIVTGPVGVGKTTAIDEMGALLIAAGLPIAAVSLDELTRYHPRARDDPWGNRVALANLAAVWRNYAKAGAKRLLIAGVIEHRAELAGYRRAIPGADITVVRLRARLATLRRRIRARHGPGVDRDWHLKRARVLAKQMDERPVEDFLVDTDGRRPPAIAAEILRRAGWPG